ncbi:hypothetical protein TSAR_005028 [Trichomalopsis sarcophagae]|uniref:Uncharacterized protein n=1 Tax=Trichomalopsis sarcophagae TaxID=543379 RepID=A0A232FKZ3_9HYME|nr:hypothetical protein TSAR_005028 [Trichomalopsis sarcophagae]
MVSNIHYQSVAFSLLLFACCCNAALFHFLGQEKSFNAFWEFTGTDICVVV